MDLTFSLPIQSAATGCDVSEFLAPPSSPVIPSPAADPSASSAAPESPTSRGISPAIPGRPAALPRACWDLPGEFSRRPATLSTLSACASAPAFLAPPGADPHPAPPMCSSVARGAGASSRRLWSNTSAARFVVQGSPRDAAPTSPPSLATCRFQATLPTRTGSKPALPRKSISDLLGHLRTSSTEVYLRLAVTDLRAISLDIPGGRVNASAVQ